MDGPLGRRPLGDDVVDPAVRRAEDPVAESNPTPDHGGEVALGAIPPEAGGSWRVDCQAHDDGDLPDLSRVHSLEAVLTALAVVTDRLDGMDGALSAFQIQAAGREAIITRLFDENQKLRGGELRTALQPVISDLFYLREALERESAGLEVVGDRPNSALLAGFAQQVELVLDRCGIERVQAALGDAFDGNSHEVVGTVETSDPTLDGTVAEARGVGFRDRVSGRMLRQASAVFYRLEQTQPRGSDDLDRSASEASEGEGS